MGAGASTKYQAASDEDKKVAVAELSEEEKKGIADALKFTGEKGEANKAAIKENKAALHKLESTVLGNKQKLYQERAYIEENRALILKNYAAAFMGNRQMANQNTDDIFRNRKAIVKALPCTTQVQLNFVESHINRARVDYLEHRAKMNSKVAKVNQKMAEINKMLIEVNNEIMEGNKEIVEFNTKHMEVNTKILAGEMGHKAEEGCDPDANATRIANNKERIAAITTKAAENSAKHEEVRKIAETNRAKIESNAAEIEERRKAIEANHDQIAANAAKISDFISKGCM
jgi:hypothetical protein